MNANTVSYPSVTMGLFLKTDVTTGTDNGDGTVTYNYDGTSYTVRSDGYSYDDVNGYVNAYLSGGYLYVRVDTQEVNYDNEWTYTWELLDADNTYEVLELTDLSNYTTTSTHSTIQEYDYWKAVSATDLNGTITYNNGTYTRTGGSLADGLKILLTDGAQNGTASTSGYPVTYNGYLIDSSGSSISTQAAQFSQAATESTANSGTYIYGVTSDTYLNGTSIWTVELTGEYATFTYYNSSTTYAPTFYLKDSSGNYLAITDSNGKYSLTTVSSKDDATKFSYNELGELNTEDSSGLKVIIEANGSYALVTGRQTDTDTRNVKIYVEETISTDGKSYTITNKRLPIITLQKVSSESTSTLLSNAEFVLYKIDESVTPATKLYYFYDGTNGVVTWSTTENKLTTDADGSISFNSLPDGTYYLEEVTAPDGYNLLNGTITFTVADGKITADSVTLKGSSGNVITGLVSVPDLSTTSLMLQVMNTPGYELPSSGGPGTWMFTLIGLVLSGGAALMLLCRYKKNNERKWNSDEPFLPSDADVIPAITFADVGSFRRFIDIRSCRQ